MRGPHMSFMFFAVPGVRLGDPRREFAATSGTASSWVPESNVSRLMDQKRRARSADHSIFMLKMSQP